MAKFPIQYANILPTEKPSQVTVNTSVDSGNQDLARGAAQLGSGMMEYQQSVEKMESEAEFRELQRKANDIEVSTFKTLMTEQDPDVRSKIYEKGKSDINSLTGKYNKTNMALEEFRANNLPAMDNKFNGIDFTMRQRRAKSTMEIAGQRALETGNLEQYNEIVRSGKETGIFTPEEADYMTQNAENNSVFAQVRILMSTKPNTAKKALEAMKGLNGEQLDKRDQLIRVAEDNMKRSSDDAIRDVVVTMDKNNTTPLENRIAMSQQMKQKVVDAGVSGTQTRVMFDEINMWTKGETPVSNYVEVVKFQTMATDLWRGSITKEKYKEELNKSLESGKLNYKEYSLALNDADAQMKQAHAAMLSQIEQESGRQLVDQKDEVGFALMLNSLNDGDKKVANNKRKIQFENLAQYNQAVRQWISENPDANINQLYTASKILMIGFKKRKDEDIINMMESPGSFEFPKTLSVGADPNQEDLSKLTEEELIKRLIGGDKSGK